MRGGRRFFAMEMFAQTIDMRFDPMTTEEEEAFFSILYMVQGMW